MVNAGKGMVVTNRPSVVFAVRLLFDCLSRVLSQTDLIGFPVVPKLNQLIKGGGGGWEKGN